jgi:hypothetical protein
VDELVIGLGEQEIVAARGRERRIPRGEQGQAVHPGAVGQPEEAQNRRRHVEK